MQVAVYEHKSFNKFIKVTSASLDFNAGGISTEHKNTRLSLYASEYGVTGLPVNMSKLDNETQHKILATFKDANGCWLSSKAYEYYQSII